MIDEVTAYIPVFRFGWKVADMTVHVRANWDEALGGLTADIFAEDDTGKRHALPQADVKAVLDEIHDSDKDAWREIIERAKADDLEGCDEDREPVSYTPHWAEDALEEMRMR